jgi:hypothetical protein
MLKSTEAVRAVLNRSKSHVNGKCFMIVEFLIWHALCEICPRLSARALPNCPVIASSKQILKTRTRFSGPGMRAFPESHKRHELPCHRMPSRFHLHAESSLPPLQDLRARPMSRALLISSGIAFEQEPSPLFDSDRQQAGQFQCSRTSSLAASSCQLRAARSPLPTRSSTAQRQGREQSRRAKIQHIAVSLCVDATVCG